MDPEKQAELKRLQKLTVKKLREEVLENYHDQIKGVHGMTKEQILRALCEIKGIPLQEKKEAAVDKSAIKAEIKKLKAARAQAISAKDKAALALVRKKIKRLKRKLRRAA